jgi:predicted phosphate transport protein (TIGR00153 family)
MLNIMKLFGRSPFAPLQTHMKKVEECVLLLPDIFETYWNEDYDSVEVIAKKISKTEHAADLIKNNIRNQLPKSLFLSMDRGALLEILSLQDSLADTAEDVAILLSLKKAPVLDSIKDEFKLLIDKNLEAFNKVCQVINELDELVEASFGGIEAEKVRVIIHEIAVNEHEADLIQRRIMKDMYNNDDAIPYAIFLLREKILASLSEIADISEKLAYRIRMTLEIK